MKNKEPLISIIVNCFNGEKYLNECLNSILTQSYKNYEVIFWDNQSTDKSKSIFLDIKIIVLNISQIINIHYMGKTNEKSLLENVAFLDVMICGIQINWKNK